MSQLTPHVCPAAPPTPPPAGGRGASLSQAGGSGSRALCNRGRRLAAERGKARACGPAALRCIKAPPSPGRGHRLLATLPLRALRPACRPGPQVKTILVRGSDGAGRTRWPESGRADAARHLSALPSVREVRAALAANWERDIGEMEVATCPVSTAPAWLGGGGGASRARGSGALVAPAPPARSPALPTLQPGPCRECRPRVDFGEDWLPRPRSLLLLPRRPLRAETDERLGKGAHPAAGHRAASLCQEGPGRGPAGDLAKLLRPSGEGRGWPSTAPLLP